jgi:2,3-bisphosphoglycerate-independent phosphoglycerate mutase
MTKVILLVLDGWGIGEKREGNPISQTPTPTFDWIKKNFPSLALQASGVAVGLPWGEAGNSEVGHLTMGAGRVLWQHLPRIDMAIQDGSFFKNEAFLAAFAHAKKNNGRVHLLGLLGHGKVHSSLEHFSRLLKLAKDQGISEALLHIFTEEEASPEEKAEKILANLEAEAKEIGVGRLSSISGRFYAMDRDEHWERTERAFRLLTEGTKIKPSANEVFAEAGERDLGDEYIEPTLVGKPEEAQKLIIKPGDSLIFFNFREDAVRQLVEAFSKDDFAGFERKKPENIYITTMTQYLDDPSIAVAFPPEKITEPLAKVVADAGKHQLHLAESERAAHVTFFFNGLNPQPFPGEYWVIVPSPTAFNLGETPELASQEVLNRLLQSVEENIYDFTLVNFPNADLIGHTGNLDAGLKVVAVMDRIVNTVSKVALKKKIPLLITADHGNIENMLHALSGRAERGHETSPVPFYLVDQRFLRERSGREIAQNEKEIRGGLIDIAPTVIELLGIEKPQSMTGQSLLQYCR